MRLKSGQVREIHLSSERTVIVRIASDDDEQQPTKTLTIIPKKIREEDAEALRETTETTLLLKRNSELFYIPLGRAADVHTQFFGIHLCPNCGRCSALSGKRGCEKVRNRGRGKRLEKYRFIADGYEVINGTRVNESFIVENCADFVPDNDTAFEEAMALFEDDSDSESEEIALGGVGRAGGLDEVYHIPASIMLALGFC